MRNSFHLAGVLCALISSSSFAAKLDIPGIESGAGAKGRWIESEKTYQLTFPRDLGAAPQLSTTSWATFQSGKEKPAIMLAEFVLLADEVNPAIDAALASNLEVTALFVKSGLRAKPIHALHVGGEGSAAEMAAGVRKIRDAIGNARPIETREKIEPGNLNTSALDPIIGGKGAMEAGVYKVAWAREATMPCGCRVSSTMGFATSASICGSEGRATVAGAIACVYGETPGVLKALRAANIEITAITNHTDAEAPRMLFVHFTGAGEASALARTIKAAIDAQKTRSGAHQHHHH